MNQKYSVSERSHLAKVKSLSCSVCDAPAPSEAHHIKQSNAYSCAALCHDCHTGLHGNYGQRAQWRIKKMDEHDALYVTIERLLNGCDGWHNLYP